MKIYNHFQIEDGSFATAKKFLTVKLSCDDIIKKNNIIIKSLKVYSPKRIILYDDFLEHGITSIHTSGGHEWSFDYDGTEIELGSVVVLEIKFYEDKQFSEIYIIKIGNGNKDWKNGLVYDGNDSTLIELEGYETLRQYWNLDV